jgi:hypothetical protein
MDWTMVIERNGGALRRIVAMLVAMAGLSSPLEGFEARSSGRASGSTVGREGRGDCEAIGVPGNMRQASDEGVFTLPRHRHRAILRLLRPAESAARRLIIVMAQGLVVTLAPSRPRRPRPAPLAPVLRSLGIAVVTSGSADMAGRVAAGPRKAVLPLIDPLKSFAPRRRTVPAHAAPRIMRLDLEAPYHPLPPPPARDDPLDATALSRRLRALGAALDDLPGQARRFARWQARTRDAAGAQNENTDAAGAQRENFASRDAAGAQTKSRARRSWPLRPGRAPGQIKAERRRQDVHHVLTDLHYFACEVLATRDTS